MGLGRRVHKKGERYLNTQDEAGVLMLEWPPSRLLKGQLHGIRGRRLSPRTRGLNVLDSPGNAVSVTHL